jgi:hypothetical protein
MSKKLEGLKQDVKQNEIGTMCIDATTFKSEKTHESQFVKDSREMNKESKELSATAILKANVSETLSVWNKQHICSALFANIKASKIDSFISVTENCTIYPVKDYSGESKIIRTEIQEGKAFSFIEFPNNLTSASIVSIYNAVETYYKAKKESELNAIDNAKKAKQAQIIALQTVISITTDETVLNALRTQLEMLQK